MDGRLDIFADRLITQINYRFVYKEHDHPLHGLEAIRDSLDCLSTLLPSHSCALLQISNNIDEGRGWTYGQLLAALDDERVIEKYLILLNKLSRDEISCEQIFGILCMADDKGYIFGRRGSVKNRQDFISFLCRLTRGECATGIDIEDIQALLDIQDRQGMTFLHDITPYLQLNSKNLERKQYAALVYSMIDNQFLSGFGYTLLAKYEEVIAHYILHSLSGEEKIAALKNASCSDHPLGKFFRFKHGSNETRILKDFRIALHELQPFDGEMTDYEVRTCETLPLAWWGFFGRKAKEDCIPLQTFVSSETKEGFLSRSS